MALKDFVSEPVEVHVGDKSFTVAGVTLAQLAVLSNKYLPAMQELMNTKKADGDTFKTLLTEFPDFVTEVISAGTGESIDVCKRLPAGVQLRAVIAIWGETALDSDFLAQIATKISEGAVAIQKVLPK